VGNLLTSLYNGANRIEYLGWDANRRCGALLTLAECEAAVGITRPIPLLLQAETHRRGQPQNSSSNI
jgi:hypothetical protein